MALNNKCEKGPLKGYLQPGMLSSSYAEVLY